MIWLTSDLHFWHNKDFIYTPRGYETVKEMNADIFLNFLAFVNPDDDLYILGDLLLGGDEHLKEGLDLIEGLPGHLHIVRGNHDTNKRWAAYKELSNVVECENAIYLDYNKYHFYLSHYPTITSNHDYDKPLKARLINLCGHSHVKNPFEDIDKGYIYHIEVDAHQNYPVSIDRIIAEMRTYEEGNSHYIIDKMI